MPPALGRLRTCLDEVLAATPPSPPADRRAGASAATRGDSSLDRGGGSSLDRGGSSSLDRSGGSSLDRGDGSSFDRGGGGSLDRGGGGIGLNSGGGGAERVVVLWATDHEGLARPLLDGLLAAGTARNTPCVLR
jgi:hypothetical protein